jgi:hypothetical protein
VIANAVNLPDHFAVTRVPACEISPDSDLGDLLVTRGVAPLSQPEIEIALNSGLQVATLLREKGLIRSAALCLQKCVRVLPPKPEMLAPLCRNDFLKCAVCTSDGFAGPSAPEIQGQLELAGRTNPHA